MALSKIFCRASWGTEKAGAYSTTFWWRRWTEQVTVEEVDHIAVVVRQDLDLHVLGARSGISR